MNRTPRKTVRRANGAPAHVQPLAALYESDETAWLEESSRLIRAGQLEALDCEHLASYLEDMARRDRREVNSRLRVLIAHLLKWQYQPEKRSRSWTQTIINQRFELEGILESSTLRQHAEDVLAKIFPSAVKSATNQTRLPRNAFPGDCPFTLDQILTEELA
jgi:Domain of unknown function DUF29